MRALIAVAFILLAVSAASAQGVKVDRVDIVETGIYAVALGAQTLGANGPSGTITAVTTVKNVAATTTIPAGIGTEFGLRYRIVGEPSGTAVSLDIVIDYPKPGLVDPAVPQPLADSHFSRVKNIGDTVYLGYGFEDPWELVPGTWTFEIWYRGTKLAEQSFTVTKG